ncbi:MAG TPA: hypothetical protein VK548_28985 [Candidatus Acidoferrum sp.]|nr:hypothetical protein [Candidatus Acidoferrum sp.]
MSKANVTDAEAFAAEAKGVRTRLLLELEQSSSVSQLAEFQVHLKDEIIRAESNRGAGRHHLEVKEHLFRLRLLGDSLAWRLLHRHAIRNLAKNDGRPPRLSDRRHEIENCMAAVRWLSTEGISAICTDLTHCLRIGDVIIVRHPEIPEILEFKARVRDDRYRHQGRAGRQLHRMEKTIEYLSRGAAQFRDESIARMSLEIDLRAKHDFLQVGSVAATALRDGASTEMLRPRQWLGACRLGCEPIAPAEARQFTDLRLCIGSLADALPNLLHEVPPPLNWPISLDLRRALMEGELVLFHIVDPRLLETERIRRVLFDRRGNGAFEVDAGGNTFQCSDYFLRQLLYGFQTPDSVAETMNALALKTSELGILPTASRTRT